MAMETRRAEGDVGKGLTDGSMLIATSRFGCLLGPLWHRKQAIECFFFFFGFFFLFFSFFPFVFSPCGPPDIRPAT